MPGKLTYFDAGGRAEGIRALLGHAQQQYTDERCSPEQFGQLKTSGALPLGSMPIWEEDGFQMVQSSAILRMLGIRLGYYSDDAMIAWQIDSMVDFAEDLQPKYGGYISPVVFGGQIDESKGDEWIANFWAKIIDVMEKRLASHGKKFIAGTDTPTIADFKCFQSCIGIIPENPAMAIPQSVLTKVNNLINQNVNYKRWLDVMKQELGPYIQARPPRAL